MPRMAGLFLLWLPTNILRNGGDRPELSILASSRVARDRAAVSASQTLDGDQAGSREMSRMPSSMADTAREGEWTGLR
jgi:hypothetical protein